MGSIKLATLETHYFLYSMPKNKKKTIMPKKLTKQDARDLISSKIKSIKDERGIEIKFLGFLNNIWIGNTTKLILKL